ncbi:MAG: ComEA family DNA-binding protein [Clostridia bacterium]|nr:ComEA family DNA-binding protein [Clostridia bacterium]
MSKRLEENENLESFFRKNEKLLKENEKYSRFLFAPIIVIIVSLLILSYNITAGRKLNNQPRVLSDTTHNTESVDAEQELRLTEDIESEKDKINLNTATASEFDSLPGIGKAKAAAIVKTREAMNGFRSIEDILNVEGIGDGILEEIKDMVFVE